MEGEFDGGPAGAPDVALPWGKAGPDSEYHPAVHHMLDVGFVAGAFLDPGDGATRMRCMLGRVLGAEPEGLGSWLPWLVALHDIGKVTVHFQRQSQVQQARIEAAGLPFGTPPLKAIHHTSLGAAYCVTAPELGDRCGAVLAPVVREAIGGHHGRYQDPGVILESVRALAAGGPTWADLRGRIALLLIDLLEARAPAAEPPNLTAAAAALTAFTILCDWLGSDTSVFPAEPGVPVGDYVELSRERARRAVIRAGFAPPPPTDRRRTFAALFPHIDTPYPVQSAIDDLADADLIGPVLCVIEAPTGEGKTEAALALARRVAGDAPDELYFALPTEATSNQMHSRLTRFFAGRPVKLVHAHALLAEDDLVTSPAPDAPESRENQTVPLQWFGPRKRALLAPLGVGTIDQAELAVLNVRHGVLRLLGLAGKVVIVDEVHAYDTYMTTIIEHLLRWLSALGASVILLSATLPNRRREALVRAFGGEPGEPTADYPQIIVARSGRRALHLTPPPSRSERRIALEWLRVGSADVHVMAEALTAEIRDGGCAAWIANTVARAQCIYSAVRTIAPNVPALLLHSRFMQEQRARLELDLVARYGPPDQAARPTRGIVIGTQVLEQSLDIDFDVLFTDLAPTDLILQRAGRMHRHPGRDRPERHTTPRLIINLPSAGPTGAPGVPDTLVYDEFVLRKSLNVLRACGPEIVLPRQTRGLIEATYDDSIPEGDEDLLRVRRAHERRESLYRDEARVRLFVPPRAEEVILTVNAFDQHEEEVGARWLRAKTRLDADSVTLIPLHSSPDGELFIDAARTEPLPKAHLTRTAQLALLRRSLRTSHRGVVAWARSTAERAPWGAAALLSGCVALPLTHRAAVLESDGRKCRVELDDELGLTIENEWRGDG